MIRLAGEPTPARRYGARPKRGRLSHSDRKRVLELFDSGHSCDQIAEQLQRTAGLVERTVHERERRSQALSVAAPQETARLRHVFWLRPGVKVELELPVDLREDEVDRLAHYLKTLRFR